MLFSDEPDEAAEMLARVSAFGRFALEIDRGSPCESLRRMTAMEELVMSCSSFSWWARGWEIPGRSSFRMTGLSAVWKTTGIFTFPIG